MAGHAVPNAESGKPTPKNDIKITTNPTHTIISLNNWHKYQSSQRDEDRYRENKSYNAFA